MSSDDGGFLSRWSRRKALVREGAALAEAPAPVLPEAAPAPPAAVVVPPEPAVPAARATPNEPDQPDEAAPPAPTLDDVAGLTPASDFTRFVARDVDPAVKNAALKKLFADPQFNVMDGLDTYIDDYGKPDPLPEGMLRQMVQAQFLGLFSDDKPSDEAPRAEPAAALPGAPPPDIEPKEPSDENADLRLQPHDAADAGDAGAARPGADEDAGREC